MSVCLSASIKKYTSKCKCLVKRTVNVNQLGFKLRTSRNISLIAMEFIKTELELTINSRKSMCIICLGFL